MVSTNYKTLETYIQYDKCEGLNIEGYESIKEVFGFGGLVKSNKNDPEIIININFKEKINISGIMLESTNEGILY